MSRTKSSRNGVCLVWKMLPHPWRLFLCYLELHSAHILQNHKHRHFNYQIPFILSEPRKLSFNTTFSTQNIGLGFRVITFTPEKKHTGMFGAMPEAPSGIAPNTFPCFCCPGIVYLYKTETATLSSQKIRMSLFRRKKAPAGALSPSTVLLRGVLSVYKKETAILSSQKIRMSFSGREAPAGALSPSTVLLRGILSVIRQNS